MSTETNDEHPLSSQGEERLTTAVDRLEGVLQSLSSVYADRVSSSNESLQIALAERDQAQAQVAQLNQDLKESQAEQTRLQTVIDDVANRVDKAIQDAQHVLGS